AAEQQDAAQQGRERADYGKTDQDRVMRILPRLEIHDVQAPGKIVDAPSRCMQRDDLACMVVDMKRGPGGIAHFPCGRAAAHSTVRLSRWQIGDLLDLARAGIACFGYPPGLFVDHGWDTAA